MYTMKHLDFGDVLKIGEWFQVLWVSCVVQEFTLQPKFLGYLTGHRWDASTVLA
jgi:hypothetical protein